MNPLKSSHETHNYQVQYILKDKKRFFFEAVSHNLNMCEAIHI